MDLPIKKAKPRIRLVSSSGSCRGCAWEDVRGDRVCTRHSPVRCIQDGRYYILKLVQEGVSAST